MTPLFVSDTVDVFSCDARELLASLPEHSLDAVVTDPPYEIGFMGKSWDSTGIANDAAFWRLALRAMKPGAHLLSFGATRTYHRMACAIEDAGFEIRDSLHWFYGNGFPKSLNLGDGRGTALKPGHEPIVLARKPLEGTVAQNVAKWGTGVLNIDACRISSKEAPSHRWPANILFDEESAAELDGQSGFSKSSGKEIHSKARPKSVAKGAEYARMSLGHEDSGGASRFFYVAKPSRKERDEGCAHLPTKSAGEATDREEGSEGIENPRAGAGRSGGVRNFHPTVKPVTLMRYLIRLVTPLEGLVFDPFVGSGTTGVAAILEKRGFAGSEMTEDYAPIIHARLSEALKCDS